MAESKAKRVKVLFVCVGNSCRSPMAEAIARHAAADIIEASSAGLMALGFVARPTIRVLEELGFPADGLRSKMLTRGALDAADVVVNMSGQALARVANGAQVQDWEVGDPFGEDLEVYRKICKEIEGRIEELAATLRAKNEIKQP